LSDLSKKVNAKATVVKDRRWGYLKKKENGLLEMGFRILLAVVFMKKNYIP